MVKRRHTYPYHLDPGAVTALSDDEIVAILRATDPIIASGGRTLLAKILKGSKDKAVLAHELDSNPYYGAFADRSIKLITNMIDYCIMNDYLRIEYDKKMPILLYTDRGWAIERITYANELLVLIQTGVSTGNHDFIGRMLTVNPECVLLALRQLDTKDDQELQKALSVWLPQAKGKVKKKLNSLLSSL
jgi:hypothetical protein